MHSKNDLNFFEFREREFCNGILAIFKEQKCLNIALQVLALEHEMEKPWNYIKPFGVLTCGMLIVICVHVFVGAIGYLKWGPAGLANFIRNHDKHDV